MKKVLSLLLLLGGITSVLHGGVAAEADINALTVNRSAQTVSSGSFILTAVVNSASANTGTALALKLANGHGFFYLKNFGTETLPGFTMTQNLSNATIRYCQGQEFASRSVTTCFDGSAAILVGKGKTLSSILFSSALVPGASYAFSCDGGESANNSISVSVSSANITNQVTFS